LWVKPWNLYWSAIGLFTAGIGVQCYGFFLRMQIAGRPPVTNMYESVVWVGFGIAAIALLFELTSRSRYYLLAAAPLAMACLILADSLPAVLDPGISPLVPVLRDNFWLSIHVPTIALSYASFALALGLGHVALGNYLFAPNAKKRIKTLSQLNYRVLQVGVLLLTAGIILGGIWAHFSWGRFWGWDPKETWALIALLCYLAPLHSRLTGWMGDFGINVSSVVSFNAVLMAWYGVNFVLGTGLHSYGFGTGGSALVIAGVVGLDLLFVAIAAVRHYGWFEGFGKASTETNHVDGIIVGD
ncbi:MAG: cytochrome c biogenesis protein, partial [Elainellaceae cyanobacterium]